MVLSWNSWNCPLTKRSTRLDFPTADSPKSTSLNWQILLPEFGPLGRVAPPLPAMAHYPVCRLLATYWKEKQNKQKITWTGEREQSKGYIHILMYAHTSLFISEGSFCRWRRISGEILAVTDFKASAESAEMLLSEILCFLVKQPLVVSNKSLNRCNQQHTKTTWVWHMQETRIHFPTFDATL